MRPFFSLATGTKLNLTLCPLYRGVMWPPIDQLTVDGYDMTWGTNVLGTKISISESPPVLSAFF